MLIPRLRFIFTLGFPSFLIFCATLALFVNINVWENIGAIKKDLKLAFIERPEFLIKVVSVDGSSDELANEIREILPLDFPVSYFDKKFKNSFGVILDDVVAGLYVVLTLIIFMVIKSKFFS